MSLFIVVVVAVVIVIIIIIIIILHSCGGADQLSLTDICVNEIHCYPRNCCGKYFWCVNGYAYPVNTVPASTLCYDGVLIWDTDPRCAGVSCESSPSPPPHPS